MKFTTPIPVLVAGICSLLAPASIQAQQLGMTNEISQFGITWHFDKPYTYGTYASGDYWVVGPVTLIGIAPEFDGTNHGWEVNPVVSGAHGFQSGCSGDGFDASLVPPLPYVADPSDGILSIIKTTPSGIARPCIKTAAVLTVVPSVPEGGGAGLFRPPYVGTDKPHYRVDDLRTDLLPGFAPVDDMPTLEKVREDFIKFRMDHKTGVLGRSLRPQDHMDDYQPANTGTQNAAVLRFMMNDPVADRVSAMIPFIQFGIDKIHMVYLGQTWPDGGGHQPGHRIVMAFAAVMLDLNEAKMVLSEANAFHDSRYFVVGRTGMSLWGTADYASERGYWAYIETQSGNRSIRDPYGCIDGGKAPNGAYQHICSQSYKGEMLATHLMPVLKEAWNPTAWAVTSSYADRWVLHGLWTLPDPAAPYDGNPANYGITYGPDPHNIGLPIRGSGRFPDSNGKFRDEGQYRSAFVASMWDAYRSSAAGAASTPPYGAMILPQPDATVSGPVRLAATAYGIHGVESVQFLLDGSPIEAPLTLPDPVPPSGFTPPYSMQWDTALVPQGEHTIAVLVGDSRGNTYTSHPLSLTVAHPGNRSPVLSPIGPKSTPAGQALRFPVNASDPDEDPLSLSATGG